MKKKYCNLNRKSQDDDNINDIRNDDKRFKTVFDNLRVETVKSSNSLLNTNPFAILDSNEDTDDLAGKISRNININQFGVNNHHTKNAPKQRIPPISINKPFANQKEAFSNMGKMLKGKVAFKILKEGYNVTLESLEDHSAMKNLLAQQKIPFYTYTTLDKKPLRLVLKGVHHTYTPDDITDDLSSQKSESSECSTNVWKRKSNHGYVHREFRTRIKIERDLKND